MFKLFYFLLLKIINFYRVFSILETCDVRFNHPEFSVVLSNVFLFIRVKSLFYGLSVIVTGHKKIRKLRRNCVIC